MSRMGGTEFNVNEIARYLDKLKQEKRITDQNIQTLERERKSLDSQIADLESRRNELNNRLRHEQEIADKQDKSISQADSAYKKIIDSSRTLAEFVKSEFNETRRE